MTNRNIISTQNISFRIAEKSDISDITNFMKDTAQSEQPKGHKASEISKESLDILDQCVSILAIIDNNTVGVISILVRNYTECSYDKKFALVFLVNVIERLRRRGIGSLLLTKCLSLLEEEHVESLQLQVNSSNKSAISFYQRHNFIVKSFAMTKNLTLSDNND